MVVDLAFLYAIGHFWVETITRGDEDYFGVCVENVEDATCCYLGRR